MKNIRDSEDFFLTIAATDPTGEAGVVKDCKIADHFGYNSLLVITAITVQNDSKVKDIYPVTDDVLREQLEICSEYPVNCIKIGALGNSRQARIIADSLALFPEAVIVWDPVFSPTEGKPFVGTNEIGQVCSIFLPVVDVITPNFDELKLILANRRYELHESSAVQMVDDTSSYSFSTDSKTWQAVQKICQKVNSTFYITGGHSRSDDNTIREFLIDRYRIRPFEYRKISFRYRHGTGCSFSTALACLLKISSTIDDACRMSVRFVTDIYNQNIK